MDFKKVELSDLPKLQQMLTNYEGRMCDISPGNLIMWRDYYHISYLQEGGEYAIRYGSMDGTECYYCSRGMVEPLLGALGGEAILTCLCADEVAYLQQHFTCGEAVHERDWDDYLYEASAIVSLTGKRYHGQRNHINKFKKNYPQALFTSITAENAEEICDFCYSYFHEMGREGAEVDGYEEAALYEQLRHWDAYGQLGGVLCVDGRVVGFSVGEIVGETLIVHTEKADRRYDGVYPMLVQSFAAQYARDCRYINREEDCGEAGLRTSKLSYHPMEIREKYCMKVSLKV